MQKISPKSPSAVASCIPTIKEAAANALALSPQNTLFANYYGLPAISVPCGFDDTGLPSRLQFVGKPQDDETVLRTAHQYQKSTPWFTEHPG
jgi:aspartyl-tRNA(Asn)/glutamyl-tRNA(Gln) amidotransferase subunit A